MVFIEYSIHYLLLFFKCASINMKNKDKYQMLYRMQKLHLQIIVPTKHCDQDELLFKLILKIIIFYSN